MDVEGGKMWTAIKFTVGIFACFMASVSVAANEAIGMIKISQGQVSIQRAGAYSAARAGTRVYAADRLRTGADGSVGVTLKDNTLLSAGPNSLISLDKFKFDSKTHAGAISVGVKRGTLSVATGKIAKQSPESVEFVTPSSVLGVRGTEFMIEVIPTVEVD